MVNNIIEILLCPLPANIEDQLVTENIRVIIANVQNICSLINLRVQYWSYCTLGLNVVLFDILKTTFDFR